MKVALLILCIGAVTFLLRRVLVALVKVDLSWARMKNTVHFVKFRSSRQREEPIRMDSEEQRRGPSLQAGKGMAL
jgi:hypothetical protein